jgi:glycosyltransferase involved in cell wall biosynthesis
LSLGERLTIVCLSSQPWQDGMWTNKQHIMSRLAREHRVYYVSFGPNPLPALVRKKLAHATPLRSPAGAVLDPVRYEQAGVTVLEFLSPRAFVRKKPASHPFSIYANFDLRLELLGRFLAREGVENPVIWVYHPGYGAKVLSLPHRLVVYDCVDEYTEFPTYKADSGWLIEREAALAAAADVVTTTSAGLFERKRPLNPTRTHLVHNVGDFEHFSHARDATTPVPDDIAQLPRPVIGFLGAVSDYKLHADWLTALARRHRDYSIVLVGPVGVGDPTTDVSVLRAEPNVHLLGHRAYELLPGYVKGFDLGVIPYRINEYTTYSFPIKFFELLASGKPLVISDLPALRDYYATVRVARSADDFVSACEAALTDPTAGLAARLKLASENTWEHRVERILVHVERALAEKSAGPGARAPSV